MNYNMGEVIEANCLSVISRPIPKYPGAERFLNCFAKESSAGNRCRNNKYCLEPTAHQCCDELLYKSSWSWPLESGHPYKVTCNMLKSTDLHNISSSCDCASDRPIDLAPVSVSKGPSHSYRCRKKLHTDVSFNRTNAKPIGVPTAYFECGVAGKKCFRCPECYYVTDRKNNLKRHLGTMHQDCGKMLQCCEKMFNSKAALREHIFLLHRSGYRCNYCARSFCRKALLKRHILVHEEGKNKFQKDSDACCYDGQSKPTSRFKKPTKYPIAFAGVSLKFEAIEQNNYEPYINEDSKSNMCQFETDFNDDLSVIPIKKFNSSARTIFYNRIQSTHYDYEKDFPAADRLQSQKNCKNIAQTKIRKISECQSWFQVGCSDSRTEGIEDKPTTESSNHSSSGKSGELSSAAALNVGPSRRIMKTSDVRRLCTNPYLCTKCGLDFTHQHQIIQHGRSCEKLQHLIGQALSSV